jgi:ketopantoate reductase
MKVAIIGPGALGSLLASSLTIKQKKIPDLDLWLLDYKPERAQHLNEHGLILEENNQERHCKVKTTANPKDIGPADIIQKNFSRPIRSWSPCKMALDTLSF